MNWTPKKKERLDLADLVGSQRGYRVRQCDPGETLYFEQDRPGMVFQVVSGLVKLTRSSGQGRDVMTSLCYPGDLLCTDCGEQGCSVRATCVGPTEVAMVPKAAFHMALEQDPGACRCMVDSHQEKIREMSEMVVGLAAERVETRAARALMSLSKRLGQRQGSRILLPMPLSRQDFAEFIGTTVETAIRVLSKFRRGGLVEEGRGWLRFKEAPLRDVAGCGYSLV